MHTYDYSFDYCVRVQQNRMSAYIRAIMTRGYLNVKVFLCSLIILCVWAAAAMLIRAICAQTNQIRAILGNFFLHIFFPIFIQIPASTMILIITDRMSTTTKKKKLSMCVSRCSRLTTTMFSRYVKLKRSFCMFAHRYFIYIFLSRLSGHLRARRAVPKTN